jgi:ankyrin repeat protein
MDGRTSPLHEAARAGHADIVRLLLEAGADPLKLDGDSQTPHSLAAAGGHASVLELLEREASG